MTSCKITLASSSDSKHFLGCHVIGTSLTILTHRAFKKVRDVKCPISNPSGALYPGSRIALTLFMAIHGITCDRMQVEVRPFWWKVGWKTFRNLQPSSDFTSSLTDPETSAKHCACHVNIAHCSKQAQAIQPNRVRSDPADQIGSEASLAS